MRRPGCANQVPAKVGTNRTGRPQGGKDRSLKKEKGKKKSTWGEERGNAWNGQK